jgi:ubiquinone/menaquinone biosynthesis C-methylase UbiE
MAIMTLGYVVFGLLCFIGIFFFMVTRGALIVRGIFSHHHSCRSYVYPAYSNMGLIRLIDFQPMISAILLFQYSKLVDHIVREIRRTDLRSRKTLITSCAFGNIIPRVVESALSGGGHSVTIADIIKNELVHAERKLDKLCKLSERVTFIEENAIDMKLRDWSVSVNVMFFLLHELPHELKTRALVEAGRVLVPGGKLILAEFHRPKPLFLRMLSYSYFKVFEPFGLELWDTYDPVVVLEKTGKWDCARETFFFGNFQVIVATKG